ncbi:MAG: ABC transporter substrate-binding protein [Bacillus sp. (in: firmicutes)]
MKVVKRRHISYLFMIAALLVVLTGCGDEKSVAQDKTGTNGEVETTVLNYQGTPGSVALVELAEELGHLGPISLNYVGGTASGPESIQTTATGDTDFGWAFNGAIIKLVANGAPLKAVISYYGSDENVNLGYFTLEDSPIQSARDLIGKKVGMNAVGAHAEIVLKNYLSENGLSKKEMQQVTLVTIPPVNLEQTLRNGQIDVAVMSGLSRDRASENGGIKELFTDYDLFGDFSAGSYVFSEKFIQENPKTVERFVEGVAETIEWSKTTPREEVIALFEKIIDKRDRNENKENLRYWQSYGVAAEGGFIRESEFQIWLDWLKDTEEIKKDSVQLEDLYTNEFNPYDKKKK